MRKRIGNDIALSFSILRDGEPEDFTGKTLSLSLVMDDGTTIPFAWELDGNTIKGVVYGKDQFKTGNVSFVFVENGGLAGMASIDGNAFTLVDHSYKEDEDSEACFELGVGVSVDVTIGAVAGKDGLSAYELAVQQGFVGTLDEWLQSLSPKPTFYVGSDGYLYVSTTN